MNPPTNKELLMFWFIVLWMADIVLTYGFVSKHGIQAEANPLMRYVIQHGGWEVFALVKVAVAVFWVAVAKHAHILIHAALVAIMVVVVGGGIVMNGG